VSLTSKNVAEIMRMLEASGFDSLTLEMDGVKLELNRSGATTPAVQARAPAPSPSPTLAPAPAQPSAAPAPAEAGLVEVTAPLLGIFYRTPRPGEPPFVEVGAKVQPQTVIGIIEVMKLMNSVSAGVCGEIVEVLAPSGAMVEYGQVLIRIRPEA
jgi:acetyl-CoA carboxylase biotin carboxyl carrier protein